MGVPSDYAMTAEEVGKALGMSRSHVSAVEVNALKKLRKALEKRGLRFEDLIVAARSDRVFAGHDDYSKI